MANESDDLKRYLRDEMTPAERHAFEKRALDDPFLRDAVSGAEAVTPEVFAKDVSDLDRQLTQARTPLFTPLRIAAGVVIVATAGWLVYRTIPVAPDSLAELKNDSTALSDSTSKLLTLAAPLKDSTGETDKKDAVKSIAKAPAVKPSESQPISALPAPTSTTASSTSGAAARTEPAKAEPEKAEQAKTEPVKTEPAKTEPAIADNIAAAKTEVVEEQQEDKSAKKEATAPAQRRAAGLKAQAADRNADALSFAANDDSAKKSDIMVYTSESIAPEGTYVFATPVGGVSFTRYLEENQRIPEAARQARIRGKVTVTFDVTATGTLSGLRVMNSLGYGCDEELLRLVRNGPAWSPTLRDGKPVSSSVIVKLEFAVDR